MNNKHQNTKLPKTVFKNIYNIM